MAHYIDEPVLSVSSKEDRPKYKFDEPQILERIMEYIDGTYESHYAKKAGIQTMELIGADPLRGLHFAVGNVIKYADRFGHKEGTNQRDLLKIIHYAVIAIHFLDIQNETK